MSYNEQYSIRPLYDTEADRNAQKMFLAEVCPNDTLTRDSSRLKWQYIDNPVSRRSPSVWVFANGDRMLGQLGALPVTLTAEKNTYTAAWTADFVVHPMFRNRGVGPLLLREVSSEFDFLMALGTNDLSYPLYKKAGWADLGNVPHYIKVLDVHAILARLLPVSLQGVLAWPGNLLLRSVQRFGERSHPEVRVSPVDRFGPEFDDLWDRISPNFTCIVRRDHVYLNWKYMEQPRMRYVGFRADCSGQLRGYVVVRKTQDPFVFYGVVVDMFADPDDGEVIDALLQAAVSYLQHEGATFVRCCTSQERYQAILKRHGFVERPSQIRFMFCVRSGRKYPMGAHRFSSWFLMKGDSDMDRIPLLEDG